MESSWYHNRRLQIFLGTAVFAYGGFLWLYANRLWSLDHLQFFPVFAGVVVYLAVQRTIESADSRKKKWALGPVSGALGLAATGVSIWYDSPWLSACAVCLLGYSLLAEVPEARRFWLLLFLLLSPVLGYDRDVVHALQRVSSEWASVFLDLMQIPHLLQGNVVEIATRRLFVEEACSGISSVYLLFAIAAFYATLTSMRFVTAIPFVASSIFWAVVGNIGRIVTMAATLHQYDIDLTSGSGHEILGLVILLVSLGGLLSTAAMLQFLTEPVPESAVAKNTTYLLPSTAWNYLTRPGIQEPRFPKATVRVRRSTLLTSLSAFFVIAGATYWLDLANLTVSQPPEPTVVVNSKVIASATGRTMFSGVAGVSLKSFQQPLATDSAMAKHWKLSTPLGDVDVYLEGPLSKGTDAAAEWLEAGWKRQTQTQHPIARRSPGDRLRTDVLISPDNQRAHLHSCEILDDGTLARSPQLSASGKLARELKDRLVRSAPEKDGPPVWQLSVMLQTASPAVDSELESERLLFEQLLTRLQIAVIKTAEEQKKLKPAKETD